MKKDVVRYAGTPSIIKRVNRDSIMEIIRSNPDITMPSIAAKIGLSLTTVSKIVRELTESRYILAGDYETTSAGRPARVYRANENRKHCLVIYLTTERHHCFISNLSCSIEKTREIEHQKGASYIDELRSIIKESIEDQSDMVIGAIGVAVPGTVTDSVVTNIPSIKELEGFELGEYLHKQFCMPVVIGNITQIATVGVYSRIKEEQANLLDMIFLYMREGVSVGSVINGKLFSSKNNFAGEIGYIKSLSGCEDVDFETAYLKYAQAGDRESICKMATRLLHIVCCLLDPELIVITCPEIGVQEIEKIQRDLMATLPLKHQPNIILENVDTRRFVYGLTVMCIDKIQKMLNWSETSI